MRLHLELQTEQNIARGMEPDEARYSALREFGNVGVIQQEAREQRGWRWLEDVLSLPLIAIGVVAFPLLGGFLGAVLMWVQYRPHFPLTDDPAAKLAVFGEPLVETGKAM